MLLLLPSSAMLNECEAINGEGAIYGQIQYLTAPSAVRLSRPRHHGRSSLRGMGPDVSYEAHPLDSRVPAGGWSRRIRTSAGTVFVGEVRTTDHRREQDRRQWQSCDGVRREGARGWSYAPALDQFRGCGRAARVPRHEGASGQGPRSDLDGDGE